MKKIFSRLLLSCLIVLAGMNVAAQNGLRYDSVPGDPLKARIYMLDNGLKVYLTVYKDAPRIQTAIAVRTGSKNDPHDNTGLSHYLEHVMFKGTDEFGTKDYTSEKVLLDLIEQKFEQYRKTSDTSARRKIYHEIDSLSGVASKFAIANEYDKLLSVIGAKNTNAFTSFEETVYINDIPSNKLSPWLQIELERFSDPVFRLFHTELETVYEEKNMSLDNDDDKIFDELFSGLFKNHTYGTQTTIGTVDHLKNPSLTALKRYYSERYVPNNMAIILSGDFDPDVVIGEISSTFGQLVSKPLTPFVPGVEAPLTAPVVKEISGPDAESVTIGYRLGGNTTPDANLVTLFNKILSNGTAGLMDLNLNQAQKVLEASAFSYVLTDYSVNVFSGRAKEGQSLSEVKELILSQIEMVKAGEFPDWLIPAIVNNIKLEQTQSFESNMGRVMTLTDEFSKGETRRDAVDRINKLAAITKEDIVNFAQKNYGSNYVIVFKRNGVAEEAVKIVKPQITPVTMNRDDESEFLKRIMAAPVNPIDPVFLDYKKDVRKVEAQSGIPVYYKENMENQTFSLYYYFEMGTSHNREIALALDYLKYLGTSSLTPKEVREEFYRLGCSMDVSCTERELWISLSGLSESMPSAMSLLSRLMNDPVPNQPALGNLVADIKKKRDDDKLSKQTILWQAMYNYGVYGPKSPYTNILSDQELDALKAENLLALVKSLAEYRHSILYYGPANPEDFTAAIRKEHRVPVKLRDIPAPLAFEQKPTVSSNVYTVDYDMKQVEIIMLAKSGPYKKELVPVVRLFNEYFGGGMNSIVFQEIRESKGLAYSAYAGYRAPVRPDLSYYLFSYIGTQVDKLPEAMEAMTGLFNNMPESEKAMNASREAILNKIRTERITKAQVLFSYINALKFGLTYDIRKDVYEKIPAMTFADLKAFQQQFIREKNFTIMVLGRKADLDTATLSKYGEIKSLELKEVFGY